MLKIGVSAADVLPLEPFKPLFMKYVETKMVVIIVG
jgi:hypothetical protein